MAGTRFPFGWACFCPPKRSTECVFFSNNRLRVNHLGRGKEEPQYGEKGASCDVTKPARFPPVEWRPPQREGSRDKEEGKRLARSSGALGVRPFSDQGGHLKGHRFGFWNKEGKEGAPTNKRAWTNLEPGKKTAALSRGYRPKWKHEARTPPSNGRRGGERTWPGSKLGEKEKFLGVTKEGKPTKKGKRPDLTHNFSARKRKMEFAKIRLGGGDETILAI